MSVETYKPRCNITNIDNISPQLLATLESVPQYCTPTYQFNVIPTASASLTAIDKLMNCTIAIFGPRPYVSTTGFTEQGIITCEVSYAPYSNVQLQTSTQPRSAHQSRSVIKTPQENELSTILQELLSSCVQLQQIQKHEVFISVCIHQASSCQWYDLAFITNAISLALSMSGISLYDMATATTVYLLPNINSILPQINNTNNIDTDQTNTTITNHTNPSHKHSSKMQYTISMYPPCDILKNIITQYKIQYKPISMTISYLPSLKQITFSKLQGQLNNATISTLLNHTKTTTSNKQTDNDDDDDSDNTSYTPWSLLTTATVDMCAMIHTEQKTVLRKFVLDAMQGK